MKKIFTSLGIISLSLPLIASAQDATGGLTSIGSLVRTFTTSVVQAVGILMLTIAVVAFFYGIVRYIWGIREGEAAKIQEGGRFMTWGLIALFVMFSVWGIITYAQNILGIKGQTTITIPDIKFQSGAVSVPAPSPAPATFNNYASCMAVNGDSGTCRAMYP
jgi:hypothetical protein